MRVEPASFNALTRSRKRWSFFPFISTLSSSALSGVFGYAEEYVYGELAEVEYNGAIKDGVVALVETAAAVRRGDMLITMSYASGRWVQVLVTASIYRRLEAEAERRGAVGMNLPRCLGPHDQGPRKCAGGRGPWRHLRLDGQGV
jgi:hypothetical protein